MSTEDVTVHGHSGPPVTPAPFEPARYLTRISGSDYLEVKWRLVWMRDQHPNAKIITELVSHSDNTAVFRCHITLPSNGAEATGYGSESAGDFRDYLEKAETKAIGRACAALGFGTQFCPDFEFGAAVGRTVDTPVKAPRPRPTANGQPVGQNGNGRAAAPAGERAPAIATKNQLDAIGRLGGQPAEGMTQRAAAEMIAALQAPQAAKS